MIKSKVIKLSRETHLRAIPTTLFNLVVEDGVVCLKIDDVKYKKYSRFIFPMLAVV